MVNSYIELKMGIPGKKEAAKCVTFTVEVGIQ